MNERAAYETYAEEVVPIEDVSFETLKKIRADTRALALGGFIPWLRWEECRDAINEELWNRMP